MPQAILNRYIYLFINYEDFDFLLNIFLTILWLRFWENSNKICKLLVMNNYRSTPATCLFPKFDQMVLLNLVLTVCFNFLAILGIPAQF